MKVYRCENENGEGPWRAEVSFNELIDPYESEKWRDHGNLLPTLSDEVGGFSYGNAVHDHYSAGVTTEDLYQEWFGPFIDDLSYYGFTMHVYEVPNKYVIKGIKQCAFDKDKARLIGA